MYEEFYGFVQPPFSLTPDPRFLYRSESHDVALQQVWQAIRRKEGFIVLTGDIGTGKTTLCRTILEQFDETTFTTLVLNPFLSVEELLRDVLVSFGVVSKDALKTGRLATASKHELVRTLHDFLLSLVPLHGSAVLLIDEAQHLSPEVLEEIRVLSNLETNDQKLLQVVIVGQLNLIEMLQKPDLRQLDQRISIRCYLKPLTREEVEAYVTHRLWVAQGTTPVTFTPKAFDLVHAISGGVPRMINLVCDRALMAASETHASQITEDHVVKAAAQLGHEIPKGKIKGEKPAAVTPPAVTPRAVTLPAATPAEMPSRRPLLIGAATALVALVAAFWFIGNPLGLTSPGPLLEPPAPPARVVPAAAQALPAPEDMPVPAPIPPPVAESFSIVVGTYDNLRDAQRAESALREQKLVPYTIDVLIAPGDLRRRLLLGRYATRDEAEAARGKLGSLSENARVIIGWSERFRVPTLY
jgi:general secretion pathway protein A